MRWSHRFPEQTGNFHSISVLFCVDEIPVYSLIRSHLCCCSVLWVCKAPGSSALVATAERQNMGEKAGTCLACNFLGLLWLSRSPSLLCEEPALVLLSPGYGGVGTPSPASHKQLPSPARAAIAKPEVMQGTRGRGVDLD